MSDNPGATIIYNEEEIQERINRYELSVRPGSDFYMMCCADKKTGDVKLRMRYMEIGILYQQRAFARLQKNGYIITKDAFF